MKIVKSFFKSTGDGEHYFYFRGKLHVVDITYHEPQGEGDAHYCDVIFDDKSSFRVFRPDVVEFSEE